MNHIAFNKNWLLKYWEDQLVSGSESLYVYEIENLAFSFFISSLLQYLSSEAVNHENSIWFPNENIKTNNKFKFPE